MGYVIRGRLCGYLCDECQEPLRGTTVRFYAAEGPDVIQRAVAGAKDTLAFVDAGGVDAKAGRLIAEATVGDDGSYTAVLADKAYEGGPLDVDLYCGTVPGLKPRRKPAPPVQLHVTTVQPQWRESQEQDRLASFDYCVPVRVWCQVRARFGAWAVCGKVTVCESGASVSGVTVKAFDADWSQDDALGSDVTDAAGHFRIDYAEEDFARTPFSFISLELFPGPDLYFRVETAAGSPLLVEPSSKGRTPGRENVGHCTCVDLCLDGNVVVAPTPDIPMFTKVGQYRIDPADGEFTATGTTTVGDLAFTDDVPLVGILPAVWSPDAVEYRFLVAPLPGGAAAEVTATKMQPTAIGELEFFKWNSTLSTWVTDSVDFWANRPGATVSIPQDVGPDLPVDVNTPVQPGGWIKAPRTNDLVPGGEGRFIPNGQLALLRTTEYTNEAFDLTGLPLGAGDPVPAGQRSAAPTFAVAFEARKVVGHAGVGTNALPVIAFSNMTDTYVRHSYWGTPADPVTLAPVPVTTKGVGSLGVGELVAGGCAEIGDEIHVLFTTYHPYAGQTQVWLEGNPILPPTVFPVSVAGECVSPPGGQVVDTTLLAKCAYILWLRMDLRLTRGYGSLGWTVEDHIAFCKK
jgi:hypothetical protein